MHKRLFHHPCAVAVVFVPRLRCAGGRMPRQARHGNLTARAALPGNAAAKHDDVLGKFVGTYNGKRLQQLAQPHLERHRLACAVGIQRTAVVQKLLQFIFHIMQVDFCTHNGSQHKIACWHIIFSQTDRTPQKSHIAANQYHIHTGFLHHDPHLFQPTATRQQLVQHSYAVVCQIAARRQAAVVLLYIHRVFAPQHLHKPFQAFSNFHVCHFLWK